MRTLLLAVATSAVMTMAVPANVRAQDRDIVETALATGTFRTFARAVTEAGLLETLKGPGPFTVLAPSDEAFAKLPKATLDALFADKRAMRDVLLFHVIAGRLTADDFARLSGKARKTVEGSDARVTVEGGQVMIGSARLVKSDLVAKNGILHGIDTVLMPPAH